MIVVVAMVVAAAAVVDVVMTVVVVMAAVPVMVVSWRVYKLKKERLVSLRLPLYFHISNFLLLPAFLLKFQLRHPKLRYMMSWKMSH